MNIAAPFRELVERKLWPVALLLLAALVAVPMLLGGGGEVAPPTAATTALNAKAQAATQPVVQVAQAGLHDRDRNVLGSRKDPFAPVGVKAKKSDTPPSVAAPETKSSGAATSSGAAKSGGSGVAGTAPAVTAPVAPAKTVEVASLRVRFGLTTEEKLPTRNLKRLTSLPDADAPVVIYLGLKRDNRTAIFLVDAGAKTQGDGTCEPSPENCQTLHLKAGETAFFDVVDALGAVTAQYQLDFVKVAKKLTTAGAAKRALVSVADGGRDAVRARNSRLGRWVYNSKTGRVQRMSVRAYRAKLSARAATLGF